METAACCCEVIKIKHKKKNKQKNNREERKNRQSPIAGLSAPLPIGTMSPIAVGPLPEYCPTAISMKHHGMPISTTKIKNLNTNEPVENPIQQCYYFVNKDYFYLLLMFIF